MPRKKVLIVCHQYSIHVKSLINTLHEKGNIEVDFFTSDSDTEFLNSDILKSRNNFIYNSGSKFTRNWVATLVAMYSCFKKFIALKSKYDCIELHFPNLIFLPIHFFYKLKSSKIGVCIWGDDFQLMPKKYKFFFNYFSPTYSYVITGNKSFIPRLNSDFKFKKDIVKYIGFGSIIIDKLNENIEFKNKFKNELGISHDEIVVTCAHNASKRQNHLVIIESLKKISEDLGNCCFLFPMTYPKDEFYINEVEKALESSNLKYLIQKDFLSDSEIVKYRVVNDVFVHIQESDSFSTAMAEFFYCNCIVINGDWLNYSEIEDNGGFYLKTSKENLHTCIKNVIENIGDYKSKCVCNRDIIWEMKSWESNIKKWCSVYE